MILSPGEKIHLAIRRGFDGDLRRHFVGEVIQANDSIARVEGYAFILDSALNQFVKRPDKRTRLIGLADAGNIINILPSEVDVDAVQYRMSEKRILTVTDNKTFCMEINEFGAGR